MDYSQFRRSDQVDDDRMSKTAEVFNLLTAPMQASYWDLRNHPFQKPHDFYEQLYLKNNPVIDQSQYTRLGRQAGIADIDNFVKALRGNNGR